MGRPATPIGTHGAVRTFRYGNQWAARTLYRDFDGKSREVQRHARTKPAAERKLAQAIRDRIYIGGGAELTPDSRVSELAELWHASLELLPNSVQQYRRNLDAVVIPAVGELRVRELSVATCDRFLRAAKAKHGAGVAKTASSVLSGMCAYAAQRDCLDRNPVRDTSRISSKPKKHPKALTVAQVVDLRIWLTYDEVAIRRDIPDLVAFMLAVGMRISEACAVRWEHIDLEAGTCQIAGNVVRIKGQGLIVQEDDSSKLTNRALDIPSWCFEMLERRRETANLSDPVFPAGVDPF